MKNLKFNLLYLIVIIGLIVSCNNDDEEPISEDPIPAASCLPTHLQNDILAFYPFSGGSLNDFSGNGRHLNNPTTAVAAQDRNGNANCAFSFDRNNGDFLTYANPTFINDFDNQAFSISLWFKTSGTRDGGWYEQLIGRDTGLHCPDTYGQWSLSLSDCRNSVFGVNDYSLWGDGINNPYGDTTCIFDPSKNVWHHIVVTSDGTPAGTKMYVDGILSTNTPNTGCNSPQGTNNVGDLFLGKEYTGLLDDVIIYKRELTQNEAIELFELTACCQ